MPPDRDDSWRSDSAWISRVPHELARLWCRMLRTLSVEREEGGVVSLGDEREGERGGKGGEGREGGGLGYVDSVGARTRITLVPRQEGHPGRAMGAVDADARGSRRAEEGRAFVERFVGGRSPAEVGSGSADIRRGAGQREVLALRLFGGSAGVGAGAGAVVVVAVVGGNDVGEPDPVSPTCHAEGLCGGVRGGLGGYG